MTREVIEEVMGASEPIQASFEVIGDDVKFIKLIVNGKEKVISIEELENTLSEPCDCICREEVCDYIAEFVNHEYATDRERELVKHIIGGIQHLPSVRPKTELETWEGIHAQVTAPKGTFDKIWNEAEEDNDEI
jgi:hypothetical protein